MSSPSPEEVRERLSEFGDRVREGTVDEEFSVEFSELSEMLRQVHEASDERSDLRFELDWVLEDVPANRIEGGSTSEFFDLLNETGELPAEHELEILIRNYVVASDDEKDVNQLLDAAASGNEHAEDILRQICRHSSETVEDHTDRLVREGAEEGGIEKILREMVVNRPTILRSSTPEFYEQFKGGNQRYRWLFCRYMVEVSRIDPEYAREYVRKVFEELEMDELRSDPPNEENVAVFSNIGVEPDMPTAECGMRMVKWCPEVLNDVSGETERKVRLVSRNKRWAKGERRMAMGVRMDINEYNDLRKKAEEKGDTLREAVKKGLEEYAEGETSKNYTSE